MFELYSGPQSIQEVSWSTGQFLITYDIDIRSILVIRLVIGSQGPSLWD